MKLRRAYDRISNLSPDAAFRVGLHRMATMSYLTRARCATDRWWKRVNVDFARDAHHAYLRELGAL